MRRVAVLAGVLIAVVAAVATAQPDVSFVLQPSIFTNGATPFAIASADLDGDGNIDLAVANYDSDDVSVLWGNGDGTFTPGADTLSVGIDPNGEAPAAIAVADINGDGKLDIITANESADTVTVLLNLGDRTFAAAKESPTGMSPEAIAVGYFDGDGKLDVATANSYDDTVTVLLGNGDGTFSTLSFCSTAPAQSCHSSGECPSNGDCNAQPIPVGSEPYGLVAVDLNHDQVPDLVVVNSSGGDDSTGSLTVLRGLGNGTFACVAGTDASCSAPEITSPTFDDPLAIAAGQGPADLNGDQNPDVVVVNDIGDSLSVLFGNGDLTFQGAVALSPGTDTLPEGVVVEDFNGDGIPDIACSASLQDKVFVFVGQGNGNFAAAVGFELPIDSFPYGLTAGDFNGDGKPDLAVGGITDPAVVSVLQNTSASTAQVAAAAAGATTLVLQTVPPGFPLSGTITMIASQAVNILFTRSENTLTLASPIPSDVSAGTTITAIITPSGCVGDCSGDGVVSIDEIMTMVNIALGDLQISSCQAGDQNGDGQITVDEILSAVNNALNGCGA